MLFFEDLYPFYQQSSYSAVFLDLTTSILDLIVKPRPDTSNSRSISYSESILTCANSCLVLCLSQKGYDFDVVTTRQFKGKLRQRSGSCAGSWSAAGRSCWASSDRSASKLNALFSDIPVCGPRPPIFTWLFQCGQLDLRECL